MELNALRRNIDELDRQLVTLLERRLDVAAAIGAYKAAHHLPVRDAARETEKIATVRNMCRPETADFIESIFRSTIAASSAYEAKRMGEDHA